jgi:hypothetical protein
MIAESLNIPNILQILKEDFCSQDFFFLHDNAPTHKAARLPIFDPKKMLQPFTTPCILQIYLRQTIFCFPS